MESKQLHNLFLEVADIRKRLNTLAPELSKLEAPKYNDTELKAKISSLKTHVSEELRKAKENGVSEEAIMKRFEAEIAAIKKHVDDKPTIIQIKNTPLVGWSDGQPVPVELNDLLPPLKAGEALAWNGTELVSKPLEIKAEPDTKTFNRFDFKDINDTETNWVVADIQDSKTWVENIFLYYPLDFATVETPALSLSINYGEESVAVSPSHSLQRIHVDKPSPFKVTVVVDEEKELISGLLEVWVEKKKFTT